MSNIINYRTDLRSSSLWRGRHCASLRMHTSPCSTARKQVPGLLSFGLMLASKSTQSNCVLFSKHPVQKSQPKKRSKVLGLKSKRTMHASNDRTYENHAYSNTHVDPVDSTCNPPTSDQSLFQENKLSAHAGSSRVPLMMKPFP